jgi:hypothetical protein
MKSIVLATAISLFLISCKKDGGSDKEKTILLTEVSSNGLKEMRLHYDANNYLVKMEGFNADPADNSMSSYIVFLNDAEGRIEQFTSYIMPANIAAAKGIVTYDASGKITGATSYDLMGISPNTPHATSTITYNAKDQVIKTVRKDKDGKMLEQENLSYFEDGHIKERSSWKETDGQLWMTGKSSYSLPGGYYPNGLEQLQVLLGPDFIARMYSETIVHLTYSQAGVITKHWTAQMSAREFNEDQTLKKQTTTHKYIKPEDDDKVYTKEYKYIKQ